MATLRTGVGKRAVGAWLRQHHAARLELVVIAAVLLIKFCSGLQKVAFHPDESQWIGTSYAFQAWIGGDFSAPVWEDSYWTRTQPPLTRYLIAVGWLTGGYNFRDLNTPWIWGFDEATNLARGALPSPGVLWWSRLPMAILAAVSALAFFVLVTESAGRLAGYILVILFAYNHFLLYALRRAMSETPLLACLALAMLAGCSAATSWQQLRGSAPGWLRSFIQPLLRFGLMGFLCGGATAAKLNGALAVLAGLALVALLAATRTAHLSRVFRVAVVSCSAVVITASAAGTFVACNPYLYPNVPARSMAMLRQRFAEMAKQQDFAPSQVIRGPQAHAVEILRSVFENLATLSFAWSRLLNLPLCIVGFGYFVAAGWRWVRGSAGSAAAAVTVLTALTCATPALLTPLAWDRYFLLPVVFSTLFIAVGLFAVLDAAVSEGNKALRRYSLARAPDVGRCLALRRSNLQAGHMFTGIIEEVGEVIEAGSGVLRIRARQVMEDAKLGDSIAINGVDLTVAELEGGSFKANVMPETYRRSNLGILKPGDGVNLERSVRPSDRLSGHIVRGVVEGTAIIQSMTPECDAMIVRFRTPPELLRYMVVKGPVAIDGASLTIIDKTADTFAVSLVQYTLEHTNVLRKRVGDSVNIETDIIARYVEALFSIPEAEAR